MSVAPFKTCMFQREVTIHGLKHFFLSFFFLLFWLYEKSVYCIDVCLFFKWTKSHISSFTIESIEKYKDMHQLRLQGQDQVKNVRKLFPILN